MRVTHFAIYSRTKITVCGKLEPESTVVTVLEWHQSPNRCQDCVMRLIERARNQPLPSVVHLAPTPDNRVLCGLNRTNKEVATEIEDWFATERRCYNCIRTLGEWLCRSV